MSRSNHTVSEPRAFSAALYAAQFVVRYCTGLFFSSPMPTAYTLTTVGCATKPGTTVRYAYHPDGSLSDVTSNDSARSFYSSDDQFCAISDSNNGALVGTSFLIFNNRRIGAYADQQGRSYYDTGNGSTLSLFGEGSTFDNGYSAYGQADAAATTAAASFGWKQEYSDPSSGLVYLRSRFYNPTLRRFMSRDTANFDNRYAFGIGDPVNRLDPSGHVSWAAMLGGVGAIIGGIAAIVLAAPSMGASLAAGAALSTAETGLAVTETTETVAGAGAEASASIRASSPGFAALFQQAGPSEKIGILAPMLAGLFGAAAGVTSLVHAYDDSDAVDDATNVLIAASAICGLGCLLFRPPPTYSTLAQNITKLAGTGMSKVKTGCIDLARMTMDAISHLPNNIASGGQSFGMGMGMPQMGGSMMRSPGRDLRAAEDLISEG